MAQKGLRSLAKLHSKNDGGRNVFEAVISAEVLAALKDWVAASYKKNKNHGVLIGGLAVSHYGRPRVTTDIDFLFPNEESVPSVVPGFKKCRQDSFRHEQSHVDVKVVTPSLMPAPIVRRICETAIMSKGVKISSPAGLIVSKLYRNDLQDKADIANILKASDFKIDLDSFPIGDKEKEKFQELLELAKYDPHPC